MNDSSFFRYRDNYTFLKHVDPRIKLPLLLIYTVVLYNISLPGLAFLSLFIILISTVSLRIKKFSEIRGAAVLSLLIFSASILTTKDFSYSICTTDRFVMTILLGMILIATTSAGEIEKAVYWFLKPVPFIPASEAAMRIRLTVTFIPELISTAGEIKDARFSRCIQSVRNPGRKITTLVIPLLYSIIQRAESTADAMEARCYTGNRDYSVGKLTKKDIMYFSTGVAAALCSLLV